MILTAEQNELVKDALWGHRYTMEQFEKGENPLDDEFGSHVFHDQYDTQGSFASLSFFNLMDPLTALHEKAKAEGHVVIGGTTLKVTTALERKSIYQKKSESLFSLDIYPDVGLDDVPAYRITYEIEALKPGVSDYSAKLYRIDPNNPDDDLPERVGNGSFIEHSKEGKEVRYSFRSPGRYIVFSEFAVVMNLLRPALEGYERRTDDMSFGMISNSGALDVLNADGGLPGPLTLYTLNLARTELSEKVLPWLADKSDKVYAALKERGMIWGEKMMLYNDLDDHVFVVPTSNPSQQAHLHENTSLISDYSAHIILTRKNEAGQNTDIKIYPIDRYKDFLPKIMEAINNDTFDRQPMIHFDLTTNSFIHFSDECPDLLDMAAFSSTCDLKQINEGKIDKLENQSTDFDRYHEEPEDEMNDDLEEDDTPAIKM
ncbi:hypothetical protein [Mesorhizobium sp. SP-1A]|uniref:hypothetical protein n=1 Tax=Mesorhizobium sp. SP-1A TaxID=3077840 RepID=UPI0028F6CD5B|nr:hypothetical protein [Mesorhizobium sp. SP-1A]